MPDLGHTTPVAMTINSEIADFAIGVFNETLTNNHISLSLTAMALPVGRLISKTSFLIDMQPRSATYAMSPYLVRHLK